MNFIKRIILTTIACVLASVSTYAASVDHASIEAGKLQSVQAAGGDSHIDITRVKHAEALLGFHSDSAVAVPMLDLNVTGTPLYSVSKNPSGSQISINLYNTIFVNDFEQLIIDGGKTIGVIEASLTQTSPLYVTTISVELLEPVSITTHFKSGHLRVMLETYSDDAELRYISQELLQTPQIAGAFLDAQVAMLRSELDASKKLCGDVLYRSIQTIEEAKMDLLEAELSQIAPAADATDSRAIEELDSSLETQEGTLQALARSYQTIINRFEREYESAQHQLENILKSVTFAKDEVEERAASLKRQYNDVKDQAKSILAATKANQEDLLTKLSDVYETLESEIEGSEHLVSKISHYRDRNLADVVHLSQANGFDALDSQFSQLRVANEQEALAASSTESVNAVESIVPLSIDTTFSAAMSTKQMPSSGARVTPPPTKRTRPSQNSLTFHSIENPKKMAMLQADENAVNDAKNNGLIVLAQASGPITDVKPSEVTNRVTRSTDPGKPRSLVISRKSSSRPAFDLYNPNLPASKDPLRQLVNIDFKGMDLSNVVALLAEKAQINVIAGTELSGTVTANLSQIPLGRAIEIVLRMNGLGIVEEAGVYRITTYEEAIASRRDTQMIFLQNAQAGAVKMTLDDVIKSTGGSAANLVAIGANEETNVIIISGPSEIVDELAIVVAELDITEPVIPTVTKAIKLDYSSPIEVAEIVKGILSENGKVGIDTRSRMVVVTDIPVKVAEIQAVVRDVDRPVEQVSIEAMIVDALLSDGAETGVDWFLNSNEFETFEGLSAGEAASEEATITELSKFAARTALAGPLTGGLLSWTMVDDDVAFGASISALLTSQNAELLANPTIITVENKPAIINITTEFPFQERTQTDRGGQLASTKFKDVGTILEVTPQVTSDKQIIAAISAKESSVIGFTADEIPIESKRTASTTLRMNDGQTVMIGGLRRTTDTVTERKVPVLGDIPFLNVFFKSQVTDQANSELLIFLTCNILPTPSPELTPYEKSQFDRLGAMPLRPNGSKHVVDSYISPDQMRDPIYKWRRTK